MPTGKVRHDEAEEAQSLAGLGQVSNHQGSQVRQVGGLGEGPCSWNRVRTYNPDGGCASGPWRADVRDSYDHIAFEDLVWALLSHSKTHIYKEEKTATGWLV